MQSAGKRRTLPTMIDVAERAGVSLKTVSRVVNDEPGASTHTRDKVRTAITELGYQRNTAASELRSGRSGLVALVVEDASEPYQSELGMAIETELSNNGILLLTVSTEANRDRANLAVAALAERRVDGLIIFPSIQHELDFSPVLDSGTHLVFVDRPSPEISTDHVRSSHRQGAYDATARLLDLGHTRVAYLGDLMTLFTGTERVSGYKQAMSDRGIQIDTRLIHLQNPDLDGVGEAFLAMCQLTDPPTAVVTGNSLTTIQLLRSPHFDSARTAHVAFDDIPLGDLLRVPLTVIRQDITTIGSTAAQLLLERIRGNVVPPRTIIVPTQLVVRESDTIPGA